MMDLTTIVVATIAAIPGILIGIATLIQAIKIHTAVNSKMDALLALTAKTSFAAGQKDEKEAAK